MSVRPGTLPRPLKSKLTSLRWLCVSWPAALPITALCCQLVLPGQSTMTAHVTAYVPLFRFSCETDAFAVAPGVRLQRSSMPPDLDLKALSEHEKHDLLGVGSWLVIDAQPRHVRSRADRMDRWGFPLWIVRP